jgi:hypothetical protein
MAEKQWSLEYIRKAKKPQLKQLATQLNIKTAGLKKKQLIEAITLNIKHNAKEVEQVHEPLLDDKTVPSQESLPKSPVPDSEPNWQDQLEFQKLHLTMELECMKSAERERQREFEREERQAKLEFESREREARIEAESRQREAESRPIN